MNEASYSLSQIRAEGPPTGSWSFVILHRIGDI